MKSTQVTIQWRAGLHLRPATRLVRLAQRFQSRLRIKIGERAADARSIFQMLLLSATLNTTMIVEAEGSDEIEAIQAVAALVERGDDDDPEDVGPTGSSPGSTERS